MQNADHEDSGEKNADDCDHAGKCAGAKRKRAMPKDVVDDGKHPRARFWPRHFKENQKDFGASRPC